jgi:hypothetical protein
LAGISDEVLGNSLASDAAAGPTVRDLIEHINGQAAKATGGAANVVSVFGWFDAASQKQFGLTYIPVTAYGPDGKINANDAGIKFTGPNITSAADILNARLITMSQPYSVTVRSAVDFKLKGILRSNLE